MKTQIMIVLVICMFVAAGCNSFHAGREPAKACTADAKLCPDGSAVGRTGPNCEFAACPATEQNNSQMIGGQKDEHGCMIAAGYSWCEAKQKCIRVWEENCSEEANDANVHVCTEQESLQTACTMDYNPVCGKMVLNTGKTAYQTFSNGCGACAAMKVVSYVPGECPAEEELCGSMSYQEAESIAKASDCVKDGGLKDSHFCNEGTRTWWIDLDITKQGCNPACVINIDTKAAEINWRCTGLVTQ